MRMYLDDQPCTANAETVGDAIAAGSAAAEEQGRCVVEVIVDGALWTNEQLEQVGLTQAKAGEVRMISARPAELVGQTFADAATALDDALLLQNDAAALLQSDDQDAAMKRLGEAFAIWGSVQQALVQGSQLVGLDLDQCDVDGKTVQEYVVVLSRQLQNVLTQLEQHDFVGVADTLLYDLPEVVDQWRELLGSLQTLIEEV